jgi:voltage-gated potassium channel Kch
LWLIVFTITTVGYGEYFPRTPLGRLIILFVAIWGTLIISIMVVVVANTLDMEKNEKRTLLILEKLNLRDEMKEKAIKFIGCFILYKKYSKRKDAES